MTLAIPVSSSRSVWSSACVHDLAGQGGRVRRRLSGHRDAVLDLGAHDPTHAHGPTLGRGADGQPSAPTSPSPQTVITSLPATVPRARCRTASGTSANG